jgi:hypothetical protein
MKLLLTLSLLLITSSVYAENKKLHCKGTQVFTYTSDYRESSHVRDFNIEFNEKKNNLSWNTYNFSMCYMNPRNETKVMKSNTQFSNESIYYECETHPISTNPDSEYFNRTTGELILDRYTGVMKTLEKSYVRKSKLEIEKIVMHSEGKYTCDVIINKKF